MTKLEDVMAALKQMGIVLWLLLRNSAFVLFWIGIVGCAVITFVYCVKTWPAQSLAVFIMVGLSAWFLMELTTARKIRLYEEQQEAWFEEKRKPAHPEYKEQQ